MWVNLIDMCIEIDPTVDSIEVYNYQDKPIRLNYVHIGNKTSKIQNFTAYTIEEHIVIQRNINLEEKDKIIRNLIP